MTLDWLPPEMREAVSPLSDVQIVTACLFGEARSEPIEGLAAVANALRNRLRTGRFGDSLAAVALKPKQFSCWTPAGGAKNYPLVLGFARALGAQRPIIDPVERQCVLIAHGIVDDYLKDNTHGATHYFAPAAMIPKGRVPDWAVGAILSAKYGRHVFYRGVK